MAPRENSLCNVGFEGLIGSGVTLVGGGVTDLDQNEYSSFILEKTALEVNFMSRRLVPFKESTFVTTFSVDDSETGLVREHKFYSKGPARTWERIKEECAKEKILPSPSVASLPNWTRSDVNDGKNVFQNELVFFVEDYGYYALRVTRVLQIEESSPVGDHTIEFQSETGDIEYVKFTEEQLNDYFDQTVIVNRSGAQQWAVNVGVDNKRLRVTLNALDALVSYVPNTGIKWTLTADLGTLA